MSNERQLLQTIQADLRLGSGRVLYLEGKTDVEPFFALLGEALPAGDLDQGVIHQGVLVRGLAGEGKLGRPPGSGSSAVQERVQVASKHGFPGVFGIIDGDGRSLSELAPQFDPPHAGPLFSWKAYCVENLVAQGAWPLSWGAEPVWVTALGEYAPYVALNRMHTDLRTRLTSLQLANFANPRPFETLLDEAAVEAALDRDRGLLLGYNAAEEFRRQVTDFRDAVARSVLEAHTLLNGKWLLRHLAPGFTGKPPEACRAEWLDAVRSAGGLTEVREFWVRIFSSSP